MTVEEAALEEQPTRVPGPGRHLREAREGRKLAVADVAKQLNLSEAVVESLEDDDIAALPSLAFARGYLRSYAKLLELSEERLIEAFNRITGEDPQPSTIKPSSSIRRLRPRRKSRVLPTLLVLLVLAGAAGGLAWWFLGHGHGAGANGVAPVASLPRIPAQATPPPAPAPAPAAAPAAATPPAEASVPEPAPPAEPQAPTAPASAAPTTSGGDETSASAAPRSSFGISSEPAPADVQSVLKLSFKEDCWIEVYDGSGKRRAYGLAKAGSTRSIDGPAPFRVFLGRAKAATVTIDGKPFDFTPYVDRDMVRFQVGPNAVNPGH